MVSIRLRSFFFFFLARFSKFRLSTMDLDVQRPLGRDLLGRVFVGTWQPSPSSFTTLLVSFPRSEPEFRFSFYSFFFFFSRHISLSLSFLLLYFSLLSLYGGHDGVCLLLLAYFNRSSVVEWNFSESQWEGTLKFMD